MLRYILYLIVFGIPGAVAASLARDYFKTHKLNLPRHGKKSRSKEHCEPSASNDAKGNNEESSAFERGEEIPQVKERLEEAVPWLVNDEEEEERIQN